MVRKETGFYAALNRFTKLFKDQGHRVNVYPSCISVTLKHNNQVVTFEYSMAAHLIGVPTLRLGFGKVGA